MNESLFVSPVLQNDSPMQCETSRDGQLRDQKLRIA